MKPKDVGITEDGFLTKWPGAGVRVQIVDGYLHAYGVPVGTCGTTTHTERLIEWDVGDGDHRWFCTPRPGNLHLKLAPTSPEAPARKVRSYQPPKTSIDALKHLRKTSDDTVWRVLRCIGKKGRTCDEVEQILGTSHQSTSARIRDLVKAGRLQDTGKRRNTRTDNKATVWRETEW